jgi:Domain of unknown function (DUF4114)/RTX calcium-binding nonapeptide repeat (4 copies)
MISSQHLENIQSQLSQFATQGNFNTVIATAFGEQIDQLQLEDLRKQLLNGDFSVIPDIQVLYGGELGTANGAYSSELDRIFVSSDFLAHASEKMVTSLLLEEVGHRIDRLLNSNMDSPGDEGEIFSLLVTGNDLSPETLAVLKSQNDHGMIRINETSSGQDIETRITIEKQDITGTEGDDNNIGSNNSGLVGSPEKDSIQGLGGNDAIFGFGGDDFINGGSGNDTLRGDDGNDSIVGEGGDDFIDGGNGDDVVGGSNGDDRISGGDGNDTLGDDGGGQDALFGGLGDDRYILTDRNGGSRISDLGGIDVLSLREGGTPDRISLNIDGFNRGVAGLQRTSTDLIIDLNRNGVIDPVDDLTIANFFDGVSAGSGFIETLENLSGSSTLDVFSKNQVSFQINSQSQNRFSEVGIFKVDDGLGNINGIKPTDAGYLEAALQRFQVVSSIIPTSNLPQGFDGKTTRSLTSGYGDIVRFGFIKDTSINALRQNPALANSLILSETAVTLTPGDIPIIWQSPIDVSLTAKVDQKLLPSLGVNTQNSSQGELLDFRNSASNVSATFSVYREAAYENSIYFYAINDETGAILDSVSGKVLTPIDAGYVQAAVRNSLADVNLSTGNQLTTTATATFNKGGLFAPIIVANGKKEAFLDNNLNNDPDAYTPFTLGNADKVDHVRLLGDNTFGFEDLKGGGDQDYNDIIVRIALQPAL